MKRRPPQNLNVVVMFSRVSTVDQGKSGLGLEAQKASMHQYATAHGLEVIAEFEEVVSGSLSLGSPTFLEAVACAMRAGARILVSKLDRLSRDFVSAVTFVEDTRTPDVVAADGSTNSRLEMRLRLMLADEERQLIKQRTRDALAALKARGGRTGYVEGNVSSTAKAQEKTAAAIDRARQLREQGLSLDATAAALNSEGFKTSRGTPWTRQSLHVRGL
jgi:DNA invertase Pin-like site-specific DNA recombinase